MQIKLDLYQESESVKHNIIALDPALFKQYPILSEQINNELQDWRVKTSLNFRKEYPFFDEDTIQVKWSKELTQSNSIDFLDLAIKAYLDFRKKVKLPDETQYWLAQTKRSQKQIKPKEKNKNDFQSIANLLSINWRRDLDCVQAQWEIEQLNDFREAILLRFTSLLAWIKKIKETLDIIGFDSGILFDLSKGELKQTDIDQLKRWASYLSEDENVRSLCELLGRLRQIETSERLEITFVDQKFKKEKSDPFSKEEIIGIKFSQDISCALPNELALLSDPETSILFDLKYIESRLMCFDMVGIQYFDEVKEIMKEKTITEEDKLGPMIICVDTSGSMQGSPENIAKAITLYFSLKARKTNRACYLINFSSKIVTIDLSRNMKMNDLIGFLKMSFHGGTDVAPAMVHAIDKMKENEYKNADVLVISDFIMADLSSEIHASIAERNLLGNKFYSLVIGHAFMRNRLNDIFDKEWIFNPSTSSLEEIVKYKRGSNCF